MPEPELNTKDGTLLFEHLEDSSDGEGLEGQKLESGRGSVLGSQISIVLNQPGVPSIMRKSQGSVISS